MFNLRAVLDLDGKGFEAGLARAKGSAARFGTEINSRLRSQLGAFLGVAAITAAVRSTVQYAGHVKDLSQALGISAERLQQFDFAAQQSGASLDDVRTFIRGLANAAQDALSGNTGAVAAFQKLGVTIDDLKKKKAEDIFLAVARSYQQGSFEEKFAALQDVGGRSAINLAAAFVDGFASIADAFQPIQTDVIDKLDEAGDKFTALGKTIQVAFAGPLAWVVDRVRDTVDFVRIQVGQIGAFIGAASTGASLEESLKIAYDTAVAPILDQRIADNLPKRTGGKPAVGFRGGANAARTAAEKLPIISKIEADQLAKIGGAVGATGDRSQSIMREQLFQLKRIETNTRDSNKLEL